MTHIEDSETILSGLHVEITLPFVSVLVGLLCHFQEVRDEEF